MQPNSQQQTGDHESGITAGHRRHRLAAARIILHVLIVYGCVHATVFSKNLFTRGWHGAAASTGCAPVAQLRRRRCIPSMRRRANVVRHPALAPKCLHHSAFDPLSTSKKTVTLQRRASSRSQSRFPCGIPSTAVHMVSDVRGRHDGSSSLSSSHHDARAKEARMGNVIATSRGM